MAKTVKNMALEIVGATASASSNLRQPAFRILAARPRQRRRRLDWSTKGRGPCVGGLTMRRRSSSLVAFFFAIATARDRMVAWICDGAGSHEIVMNPHCSMGVGEKYERLTLVFEHVLPLSHKPSQYGRCCEASKLLRTLRLAHWRAAAQRKF